MEQDLVHGGCVLALLGLHFDWVDLFYLLGRLDRAQELGRPGGTSEFPREDEHEKRPAATRILRPSLKNPLSLRAVISLFK